MKTTALFLATAIFGLAYNLSNSLCAQVQYNQWPFEYPANAAPEYTLVHDMNQDGAPDFVAYDPSEQKIAVWLNDGYGFFTNNPTNIASPVAAFNPLLRPFAVGDFNNDGNPDLLIARIFGSQIIEPMIYLNDGNGNFSIAENQLPSTVESFIYIQPTDFNDDGLTDIMVASTGTFRLFSGTSNGSFNLINTINANTNSLKWTFGDLNGNGLIDFVTSSFVFIPNVGTTPSIETFINNGDNSFTKANLNDKFANGAIANGDLALADFNGDGLPDIIVSGLNNTSLTQNELNSTGGMYTSILLNEGNNSFTEHLGHGLPRMFRGHIACADVDGDGDVDVFITGRRNAPFIDAQLVGLLEQGAKLGSVLMLNDGAANFNPAPTSTVFQNFSYNDFITPRGQAIFEDFSGNGKPDLLINGLIPPLSTSRWDLKIYSNGLNCNALTPGLLSSNLPDETFCPESHGGGLSLQVSSNSGLGVFGIVRNSNGRIVRANQSGVMNLSALQPGNYTAAHLSFLLPGQVSGVEFVGDLKGCRALSNLIPFTIAPCQSALLHSQPNPTTGLSTISFTLPENGRATLEVYDMGGRLVQSLFSGVAEEGVDYRFDFDGSHLPNGVYLYRLTTQKEVKIEKFIIAR